MSEEIEIIEQRGTPSFYFSSRAFELRPDRGYVHFQRLALWVLKKIGAFKKEVQIDYVRHVINPVDVMNKLCLSQQHVMNLMGRRPGTLYIGAEDFAKLMGKNQVLLPIQFGINFRHGNQETYRIIGMQVIVIPWMKGILPVPDDLVPYKTEQP